MHGSFFLAILNISRTLDEPTPTNISKNSLPLTVMNGTFASPAVAFANNVLPVPGGPACFERERERERDYHFYLMINWSLLFSS